ncbi:MAG TPA: rhamnulokinase family protein [Bacilli bacterium]
MNVLAFDLGAGSGRALIGSLHGRKMQIREVHRFANDPVQVKDRLHWDILRLYHEIKQGLLQAKLQAGGGLASLGIDSWAVDFGLIGDNGELLGNPYHYRDHHTDQVMDEVFALLPKEEIFRRTGIQFLQFNTIFQLYALRKAGSPILAKAQTLLMIPELLRYFLTGEQIGEFTNASTTQLYNPIDGCWDRTLLERIGVRPELFTRVCRPGTAIGGLLPSVRAELGLSDLQVTAVAEHDTGSAVAAVPAEQRHFAYLICGTWSLLGTETEKPVITDEALVFNFTNEGGVAGTNRLLKNIMGLWILEECRRTWRKQGLQLSYDEMSEQALQAESFASLIDPDDPAFLNPANMPQAIQDYCRKTGQPVPEQIGQIVRCILESLACKYRFVLEMTERLARQRYNGLHMIGGGIQNKLLCQFTANAIGRPVWAGPAEGSAVGNVLVQYMALGEIADIWEARTIVRKSFAIETYLPLEQERWEKAYTAFLQMMKSSGS